MIVREHDYWFEFLLTPIVRAMLKERGIYFDFRQDENRFGNRVRQLSALKGPSTEPFVGIYGGLWIPRMGFCSYTRSLNHPLVRVGRYCSIAPGVRMMDHSHPLDRFTTSSFTYESMQALHTEPALQLGGTGFACVPFDQKSEVVIEDDVWIGQDVLLARGITLHTGCVVAAGSVVTRSVPPYAIVGGAPARVIRTRMADHLIERMLRVQWWQYAYPHFAGLPVDPEAFLDALEERLDRGEIVQYAPARIDLFAILRVVTQMLGNTAAAHKSGAPAAVSLAGSSAL